MFDKELILEHLGILVTTYYNPNCRDCVGKCRLYKRNFGHWR